MHIHTIPDMHIHFVLLEGIMNLYNTFSFQAVYIWNENSRCISTCINVSFPKFKKISNAYIQSHYLTMRLLHLLLFPMV